MYRKLSISEPAITFEITIQTCPREGHQGRRSEHYLQVEGNEGMTLDCIYRAALKEVARIEVSLNGHT